SVPGIQVGYLAFQTEKEPFSRKKIRQAVAAAIDPAAVGTALGRTAVPPQSFPPARTWARRESSPILRGTRPAGAGPPAGRRVAERLFADAAGAERVAWLRRQRPG